MKTLLCILFTFFISFTGFSQTFELKVVVEEIEDKDGIIYLSLHDNADSFPSDDKKAVKTGKIEKFNTTAEFTFSGLKEGDYAISIFQDLNGNEEMDTNMLGIPKEPVGASNMTSLGRPKFSKCKFNVSEDSTMTIKYMN
ncbi:DUF2141 domain-containing protein [Psychroflexus montanilacus]|uniref:DUF2141 domain-containing protein n=1 Tax=Psychroflexus montanilacus TaxID=2873598 RepID=UPI001CCD4530|nr:DUF2141 domain-containing protein [Psychroflexus montanilacus]MBZ9650626.1 DUF2141 domain-containing protein [Psychroflexus montanilacus]